jgi:hypothetical protein
VDKTGQTIDFLLTNQRDEQAAKRFLAKVIRRHDVPEKVTIDGSAANEAAIKSYNAAHGTAITIRKRKYVNNVVEQDHRAVICGMNRACSNWSLPCSSRSGNGGARSKLVSLSSTKFGRCVSPENVTNPWGLLTVPPGRANPAEAPRPLSNFYREKRT